MRPAVSVTTCDLTTDVCLTASLCSQTGDTVMALTPYTDKSLESQQKSRGFLSIEVRVVVPGSWN